MRPLAADDWSDGVGRTRLPDSPAPRGARSRQGRPGARAGFMRRSALGVLRVLRMTASDPASAGPSARLRRNRPATKTRSMRDAGSTRAGAPPGRFGARSPRTPRPRPSPRNPRRRRRPTSNPRTSTSRTRPSRSTPTSAPSFTLTTKKATRRRMEEEGSGWWAWTSRRGPRGSRASRTRSRWSR